MNHAAGEEGMANIEVESGSSNANIGPTPNENAYQKMRQSSTSEPSRYFNSLHSPCNLSELSKYPTPSNPSFPY